MKNKKIGIAAAVLVAMVCVALTCWLAFKPDTVSGSKQIVVEVCHKDGGVVSYELSTDAEYLYDALAEAELVGELTDGYFVLLDGETADTAAQEWWGYTKSGEYVSYGVSQCVIEDGDHYEFTFNVGW